MIRTFKLERNFWNYYLAIEQDLIKLSRYIEFTEDNYKTYSIELSRILLSASAEIDVLLKQICSIIRPDSKNKNINDYRNIILKSLNSFIAEKIIIDRYNMSFNPWSKWEENENPDWWKSYNNVKHHRNRFYSEANLYNTINSIGALLITEVYYYQISFSKEIGENVSFIETTEQLVPESSLIKLDAHHYKYVSILDKRNFTNKAQDTT
jgi:hypothetical protein